MLFDVHSGRPADLVDTLLDDVDRVDEYGERDGDLNRHEHGTGPVAQQRGKNRAHGYHGCSPFARPWPLTVDPGCPWANPCNACVAPSLALQVHSRGHPSDTPGWIQTRHQRRNNRQDHRPDHTGRIEVRELLKPAALAEPRRRIQRMHRQSPTAPSTSPSTAPTLANTPTSTRCCWKICRRLAPSARRTPVMARAIQELGQQQADGVDEADGQKRERQADEHAVVVFHDALVDQPLSDGRQLILTGPRKAPGGVLVSPVAVHERLKALAGPGVGQLRPTSLSTHSPSS